MNNEKTNEEEVLYEKSILGDFVYILLAYYYKHKGTVVTKDTINTMDYLVRRNYYDESGERKSNHVILFYNWQSSDKSRMLIIETALSTEKTVVRVVDTDDYVECGFEMKTPW